MNAANRKRRQRAAKRAAGQKPLEVWAHPDDRGEILAFAEAMRAQRAMGLTPSRKTVSAG